MLQPSQWRAKATDYAIKAHEISDGELRRQYAELAARYLGIANELEDVGLSTATERPTGYTRRVEIRSE